jgi:AAA+ ATPase superfamily predicted ATPase
MRLESVNTTWKIEFYLQQMLTLHIIRRKVPLMGPDRAGRYFIADNMVNSWFNLTFKIMSNMIPRTSVDKPELQSILGKPFEEVMSQCVYNFRLLPFEIGRIEPWWRKDKEIDLIALDTKSKTSCFIEVKWRELWA